MNKIHKLVVEDFQKILRSMFPDEHVKSVRVRYSPESETFTIMVFGENYTLIDTNIDLIECFEEIGKRMEFRRARTHDSQSAD